MPVRVNLPSVLLKPIISGLALAHMHLHLGLVVLGRREDLGLAGRDGRVALDQLGEHTALRLDARRERSDVEQEHVLDLALEDAALDGRADGDDLVRVHALVRVLLPISSLTLSTTVSMRVMPPTGYVLDRRGLEARVGECLLRGLDRPCEQVGGQLVELRA